MTRFTLFLAACLLGPVVPLPAQSPGPGKAGATAAPAPAVALAADDLEALRAHVSQTVDVRGTPTGTGRNKAGTVVYLNFGRAHTALTVVAFLSATASSDSGARKVQSEDDLKSFVGKTVVVHGKIDDYKGDPEIVLDTIDQVTPAP